MMKSDMFTGLTLGMSSDEEKEESVIECYLRGSNAMCS